jgi:hypothetical protein
VRAGAHVAPELVEAYVLDALDEQPARALEQHVRLCAACAEALAAEARREVALADLIPRVARQPVVPPSRSGPWLSPFLLAAASALGLLITAFDPRGLRLPEAPPPLLAQGWCAAQPEVDDGQPGGVCLASAGGPDDLGGGMMCRWPMMSFRRPLAAPAAFSCSGCSCPAEPPR